MAGSPWTGALGGVIAGVTSAQPAGVDGAKAAEAAGMGAIRVAGEWSIGVTSKQAGKWTVRPRQPPRRSAAM